MKSEIERILSKFLKDCDIPYPHGIRMDETFRTDCFADATHRGFDLNLLARPLDVGIVVAHTSYSHLENYSTRVFIAVWTGLMTHIDDYYEVYADGLKEFTSRFIRQEPQKYKVLDQVVEMTREFGDHWDTIGANLVLTAEFDYLTSAIIDSAIEGMEVKTSMAPDFAGFTRSMSGISRAYCCQVFPPNLSVKDWIQVTPDFLYYINHTNDLFSFYKEELDRESLNFVSMHAKAKGITKIETLRQLADNAAECYRRGTELLQSCPEALKAFRNFCVGYIGFHALSPRYKLDQLDL
ncbi:Trichodiene synthase [Leucoagaricus sp. SymC.cos]|nr:Trichodiene synthase [Leucoagaricus sp. SymC.cos]